MGTIKVGTLEVDNIAVLTPAGDITITPDVIFSGEIGAHGDIIFSGNGDLLMSGGWLGTGAGISAGTYLTCGTYAQVGTFLLLQWQGSAPTSGDGRIVYAKGSPDWDPGEGRGYYAFHDGGWRKIQVSG
jgi:hypothetical protein